MSKLLVRLAAALFAVAATPAHAAWQEARSKHFIVYADDSAKRLEDFASKLERFDAAVRYLFKMPDPEPTDSRRLTVFVLGSNNDVGRLLGVQGAAGFYTARSDGSFAFVPRQTGYDVGQWDITAQQVFFHEYAHHLQLQTAQGSMPTWMTEGFAEMLASAVVEKDGSVLIGSPLSYRLADMETAGTPAQIASNDLSKSNKSNVSGLYARSWAMMHYLTFDSSRRGQLDTYLAALRQGKAPADAARMAFGDLGKFNADIGSYLGHPINAVRIRADRLPPIHVGLRPLGRGEAAVMPIRIQSKRGVNAVQAPVVAAEARRIAAAYPNDPVVQNALAEAEFDGKQPALAAAAADRVLASNPNDLHALIYKGRARVALAKNAGKSADWDEARSWFVKANAVDNENAEALMLFYKSFLDAGRPATVNAVDGLLYAVTLAPRDRELRLLAVRQLLSDHRFSDAKEFFSPIAFSGHSSAKMRDRMSKIENAMDDKDAATAIKLIDQPDPK